MHAVCVPNQSINQGRLAGWLASRLIDPLTRTKQQERGVSQHKRGRAGAGTGAKAGPRCIVIIIPTSFR